MDDLLDDSKGSGELIPYIKLRNEEISIVAALLTKNHIPFEVKKILSSTNDIGIIPMTSYQLEKMDAIVYIPQDTRPRVDEIMKDYYSKKKLLETEEYTEPLTLEEKRKNQLFIILSVLFLLFILGKAYWKFLM